MTFFVLEPLFVVAEPVCLAVPEEPLEEPEFVFEAVFVFEVLPVEEPVFEADGLWVGVAEPEPVYQCQYGEGRN